MASRKTRLLKFELCECGKHGRVVFPDGRTGGEIFSKENAGYVLQYCALTGALSSDELHTLHTAIDSSTIHKHDVDVGLHSLKVFETWNIAKTYKPDLDPKKFHQIESFLWHYRAFDN